MIVAPGVRTSSRLTWRWTPMFAHAEQDHLWASERRFILACAGRRSGKTEKAKRKMTKAAIGCKRYRGRFIIGAPTRQQVKDIYWQDMKDLAPERYVVDISESELKITYTSGATVQLIGFDKPMRSEGSYIDGAILDEFGDMKPEAWSLSLRNSLATKGRPGWCWLIGKPRGRNHYWDLWRKAVTRPDWARYHWSAETVLDPEEIAALKRELDEVEYDQEIRANFVSFEGRAYYTFEEEENAVEEVTRCYDPRQPLDICLDFNVAPGTASMWQLGDYDDMCETHGWRRRPQVDREVDFSVGEVNIPRGSNTERVARKIVEDFGDHEGEVWMFGDATGGAKGSAKVRGSDWDIVDDIIGRHFGDRYNKSIPPGNPDVKVRVNRLRAFFKSTDGVRHMLVDPTFCPETVADCVGTMVLKGTNGDLDKTDLLRTHITDGMGYRTIRGSRDRLKAPTTELETIA